MCYLRKTGEGTKQTCSFKILKIEIRVLWHEVKKSSVLMIVFLTDKEQLVFNLHLWLCHFISNRNVRVAIKGFQGFV